MRASAGGLPQLGASQGYIHSLALSQRVNKDKVGDVDLQTPVRTRLMQEEQEVKASLSAIADAIFKQGQGHSILCVKNLKCFFCLQTTAVKALPRTVNY